MVEENIKPQKHSWKLIDPGLIQEQTKVPYIHYQIIKIVF